MTIPDRAVWVARQNRGYGETTANNKGIFIELIGGKQGMEWCALFSGHCYRRAYQLEGEEPPSWLYRRPGVAEPGALRLWNGLALASGWRSKDPEDARLGDYMLWRRPGGHHIGLVDHIDDGIVFDWEGNTGRFPSKVKMLSHDVTKEPHFIGFTGLR